jgi:hypothetical protein
MKQEELNEAAAQLGRKGGSKKVPKGFARMTPEEKKRIQSLGGKARWPASNQKKAAAGGREADGARKRGKK